MRRAYTVIIEVDPDGTASAYIPDVPGCVAAGDSLAETYRLITEAAEFHIEGLVSAGEDVPEPTSVAATVMVQVPEVVRRAS